MKSGNQLRFPWCGITVKLPPLSWSGWLFLALSVLGFCGGLYFVNEAVLRVSLFCLLILALARPLSAANIRLLSFVREAPDLVGQRDAFPFRMTLRNGKGLTGTFDVVVDDEFARHRNPGGVLFDTVPPRCETVRGETAQVSQRGLLGPFRYALSSDFPFGFVDNTVEKVPPETLAVYPAPLLPVAIRRLLDAEIGSENNLPLPSREVAGEFRSLREYQYGDHVKLISWPVSARQQRLIVREIETTSPRSITIIHHSFRPHGFILTPGSFERSLHILSGLVHYFHGISCPFCLVSSFHDWKRIRVSADTGSFHEVLRALALAKQAAAGDKDALSSVIRGEAESSALLIVVSNTPLNYWQEALSGVCVNAICMDNRSVRVKDAGDLICA